MLHLPDSNELCDMDISNRSLPVQMFSPLIQLDYYHLGIHVCKTALLLQYHLVGILQIHYELQDQKHLTIYTYIIEYNITCLTKDNVLFKIYVTHLSPLSIIWFLVIDIMWFFLNQLCCFYFVTLISISMMCDFL